MKLIKLKDKSLFLLFFVMVSSFCIAQTQKGAPNVIIILTDDLGYGDIGCFGASDIKTPNIDRLAQEGIKFTDFYSASPICSPSRAALLTGRYPQRMGINKVFSHVSFSGMSPNETTIAELLKQKDYKTGMVGKWHLGHQYKYLPLQQGFDSYFGIPYSNDMESVVYMEGNDVVNFNVTQKFITKTYTEKAVEFIEANKNDSFFLYIAHNMPHVPIYASDEFVGTSERGLYGDVIQEIDWSVGHVLKTLESNNLLENTLVIFSSDNGPWSVMQQFGGSSGALKGEKFFTFEGGMRVPTLAMWKNTIVKGRVYDGVASQLDWFPTIAALVDFNIKELPLVDGQNLSPVLFKSNEVMNKPLLYFDGKELQCYRKGDWKVKLPYTGFSGADWKVAMKPHDTLLFNLKTDLGEKNNLFKENKDLAIRLLDEMHNDYTDLGELPPSLVMKTKADHSHFLKIKKNK